MHGYGRWETKVPGCPLDEPELQKSTGRCLFPSASYQVHPRDRVTLGREPVAEVQLPHTWPHRRQSPHLSLYMATDNRQLSFQRFSPAAHKGAQCPSCFTYNLLHLLPENRKQPHPRGLELTCALCGTQYPVEQHKPDPNLRPIQEKGAA